MPLSSRATAAEVLSHQGPLIQELLHDPVEHGVLIPLKTTLELRDDYTTGRVLVTRCPVKAANPTIRFVPSASTLTACTPAAAP